MSILIVGATGSVGSEIARKLASRGLKVAGLVRGGSAHPKAKRLTAAGVTVVQGDLTKSDSLAPAVKNVETILSTATSMPTGANEGLRRVDLEGTLTLIDAAQQHGVKKFVYVSYSGNIRQDSPLETAKRECEARLQSSAMETVVLRPSYFMEMWLSPVLGFDPAGGSARIYGSGNAKVSYISASDVAEFAAIATIKKYDQQHTALEMGGPQPLSQLDAVQIFERAWNTKLKLDCVSEQALEEQHKSFDPLQKTFAALMLAYAKGDTVDDAQSVARAHGVSLRSVGQHAADSADQTKRSVPAADPSAS
jgi:NADH dehydrogenase